MVVAPRKIPARHQPNARHSQDTTSNHGNTVAGVREYWGVIVERRRVALTTLACVVAVTMSITFLVRPKYEASTTLQIERTEPAILTFRDVVRVEAEGYRDFFKTQRGIVRSRAVLRQAAQDLDLANRPEYLARKKRVLPRFNQWLKSVFLAGDAEADAIERAAAFIDRRLTVTTMGKSQLVRITFRDEDAQLAAEVTAGVSGAYQRFNLRAKYRATEQANEFLTKEVTRVRSEITALEHRLQQYTDDKAIVRNRARDISEQSLADLHKKLTEAKSEHARVRARYDSVRRTDPYVLPEVLASPLLQQLRLQYADVERRSAAMTEHFGGEWPELFQLNEELKHITEQLEAETRGIASQVLLVTGTQLDRAQATVINLGHYVKQQAQEVRRVQRHAIQYANLKNEIDSRRAMLARLIGRSSETEISEQLRTTGASNIRVVDPPSTPDEPCSPRTVLNLVFSLLGGAWLGVGLVFLMHHVDNAITTEADLARYGGGAAVLAQIPLWEPPEYDPTEPTVARTPFAESFNNLRTALLLSSPGRAPWLIHVTSCEPRDGKSTISMNLAMALTKLDRTVLLVDADLRRPRLHRALAVPNDVGLSSVLSGNADVADVVQRTKVRGLSFVSSGPIPPNPSELLGSPTLKRMIDHLRHLGSYAHVVFDSPPVLQVADSLLLGTEADATFLVVRTGLTSRDALIDSSARLRQARVRIAGTVLNAV